MKLQSAKAGSLLQRAKKERDAGTLSLSTLATIYGCCGLFDLCSDNDLMSLSFEGASRLLDWIGWERTGVCRIKKNFITYTAPSGTAAGSPTSSIRAGACDPPNTVEFGVCDFTLEDFGRNTEIGPIRDITMNDVRLCEAQPRYRLDGTPIVDDMEYDMRMAVEVILQDIKREIIIGNKSNAGEFDGFERLVKTNYLNSNGDHCHSMDSNVFNWNSNTLDGGAGITWNGTAQDTGYDFVDMLIAAFNRVRQRISWSPMLAAQDLQVGDVALVIPSHYIDCVLNFYTCWRVCPGQPYNENNLNSFEARTFRNSLAGGMFNAGKIFLDSFEVPILPYDWGLLKGPARFDAYLLTSSVGNVKLMNAQYLDMSGVPEKTGGQYNSTDGGRLLTWIDSDETCYGRAVEMRPRLLMWAPWAQTRLQNLRCAAPLTPLSPDPTESSFFPETSLDPALCP